MHAPTSSANATATVMSGEKSPPSPSSLLERHERVHERREEAADRVLGQRVAAEPQHQPRRVLAGGELHDDEHAGEDEPGERDDPGGSRAKNVAGRADAGPRRLYIAGSVQLGHQLPEQDRGNDVKRGERDQALAVAHPALVHATSLPARSARRNHALGLKAAERAAAAQP